VASTGKLDRQRSTAVYDGQIAMTSTPNAEGFWSRSPPTGEVRRPGRPTTVPFRGDTCTPKQQAYTQFAVELSASG